MKRTSKQLQLIGLSVISAGLALAQSSPIPVERSVPAGSTVTIRMTDSLDSSHARPGEEFVASVAAPVASGEWVAVPQGSEARVRLLQPQDAGHPKSSSVVELELVSLSVGGMTYRVESDHYTVSQDKHTGHTMLKDAAIGGLIGGLGAGRIGAVMGAGLGAAGGGIYAATRHPRVQIASETKIDFVLKSPVRLASAKPVPEKGDALREEGIGLTSANNSNATANEKVSDSRR